MSPPDEIGPDVGAAVRIQDFLADDLARVADETERIEQGMVARTRSLPMVWTLNQLRITVPASVDEVVALADRHQADLPYRHVVALDPATADGLESELGGAGWRVEHDLYLALPENPHLDDRGPAPARLEVDDMLGLMRQWMSEERPEISAEALAQLDQYNLRSAQSVKELCFGVRDDESRPVALTKLRSDGTTAWVEDVYTSPSHRGRGHARRLVTHAAALAVEQGHQLVFIIADDDDWPKGLYAEVGFRPVGRGSILHFEIPGNGV